MRPRPPHLVEAASEWSAGEVKWIVEHGLKYTGMPAFGADHDDATLWNIAAVVTRLPGMTPAQYRAYGPAHAHGTAAGGGHDAMPASAPPAGERASTSGTHGHTHDEGNAAHDASQ